MDDEAFVVTKEHRRFAEFCDACRRHRYVGLCYGPPGVGKTLSARRYASWDEVEPALTAPWSAMVPGSARPSWRTLLYTPTLLATPRRLDADLAELGQRLAYLVVRDFADPSARAYPHASPPCAELLVVDEADRLKVAALEQLRDHYDRSSLGLVLVGMPGIEKRLARYPQLYSRVGFVHQFRPLGPEEQAFVLARRWPGLGLGDPEDFTAAEAVATIARITGGNFRLTQRLLAQVERLLEINELSTVTKEVVEAAREALVVGPL